jgi:hypothetical protein
MACQKEDAAVLQGDIQGRVAVIDSYGFPVSDLSGVQVLLTGENTELETTTDSQGQYGFQNLPFGKYNIQYIKENYIQFQNSPFNHIGGDAATIHNMEMNEVPEYAYGIDSMVYYQNAFVIYTHIIGATKPFKEFTNYYVQCFFSQSPDVSSENFENSFMYIARPNILYSFWYGYNWFLNNYTGTVYCRIYAQTEYGSMWEGLDANPHSIYRETLGPPSEVFSFTVAGITKTYPPAWF